MRERGKLLLQIIRRRFSSISRLLQMDSSSSPSADLDRYSYNPALHWNTEVEEYFVKAYGADHFARISKALTHPSCYSCIRVNTLKSTTDAVIKKLMAILDEKNISNTMGSMNIGKPSAIDEVDQVMRQGSFNGISIYKCEYPGIESVVFVRGSGPHMLDYGDQPGQSMKEVIVSRKCAEAVLRGAQVYVPGVLACSSHVEKGDMVAVSVAVEQPDLSSRWGVGITRGTVLQGLQSDPHYHERSGLYIGQGTALLSRAGIFRASEGIAVDMTNRVYDLPSFNDSNGKLDQRKYLSKVQHRKDTRRMRNGPGRNRCMGDRVEKSKGYMSNSFDRILLDAPCSALGLRPRLFAREETIQSLKNHAKYQRKMFEQAVQLVRPGGVIVYSTCTINPGENEALVRYALDTYKFLSVITAS